MLAEWLLFLPAITAIIIPGVNARLDLSLSNSTSVSKKTMKSILESCYGSGSSFDTVFVVGDFNEMNDKLPMIRLDFEAADNIQVSNLRLSKVIIVVDSIRDLLQNMLYLKGATRWNYTASFFIIVKEEQSCRNHYNILRKTWKIGMINSIYICPATRNTSALYMVNQYANYAPHPWKNNGRFINSIIFSQLFNENMSCRNLNYDKTIKLNGSIVKLMVWMPPDRSSKSQSDEWIMENIVPLKIIHAVAEVLNIRIHDFREKGRHIAMEKMYRGEAHVMYLPSRIDELPTVKFLFPYSQNRIVAMIKSSPEELTLRKILHLRGFSAIFLAFIALAILFFILSWKILTKSGSNSFRISFTTILIVIIISNGIFQGKMTNFLRTYGEKEPIETVATLVQLRYEFYCTPEVELQVKLHCPECRAIVAEQNECFKYALEGELAACLTEESTYPHSDFMLHPVKEPLSQTLMVTKCHNDWPLYDRMNKIWIRIFESGLQKFWETQQAHKSLLKRRVQDTDQQFTQYQPLDLYKLLFAFEFLAIGLSLSTLVFIAELLVKKYSLF